MWLVKLCHTQTWSFVDILPISACKFECISELFAYSNNFFKKMKKLTNTLKLTHKNGQNSKETSNSGVIEFNTPHALSIYYFIYGQSFPSLFS